MKLGKITRVWNCSDDDPPDDDTTMIARIGDMSTVGKVVEDWIKPGDRPISTLRNYICVKPLDKDKLVPKYLYYAMQYVHMQGNWRRVCTPYAGKQQIRVKDVRDVAISTGF